eukprot:COSAG04_NODE_1870_length_5345_cov_9.554878_2_plen_90_part_00
MHVHPGVGAATHGRHDEMAPAWVERLAAGEAQRILTYGTSLTAGGAWVEQLEGELQRRYPGEPVREPPPGAAGPGGPGAAGGVCVSGYY